MRIALLAPVTPARDRPSRTSGRDAWRSCSSSREGSSIAEVTLAAGLSVASDDFSRFVSLACHDLRTPLATVSGFAHTLQRVEDLGEPAERYVGMIQAASGQM